jgi:hypothetical protein
MRIITKYKKFRHIKILKTTFDIRTKQNWTEQNKTKNFGTRLHTLPHNHHLSLNLHSENDKSFCTCFNQINISSWYHIFEVSHWIDWSNFSHIALNNPLKSIIWMFKFLSFFITSEIRFKCEVFVSQKCFWPKPTSSFFFLHHIIKTTKKQNFTQVE